MELYRARWYSGYYLNTVTITFKPNTQYAEIHPKQAHKRFKEHFTRYLRKHGYQAIMYPEISENGQYHLHGIIAYACSATEYDRYDRNIRLLKNYINRYYGRNSFQRIYNLDPEGYPAQVFGRYGKLELMTSYDKVFKYISKDKDKYGFLDMFMV